MIRILIRRFIHNYEKVNDRRVREQYIALSGVLGIFSNLLVFSLKLVVGLAANSIAVISDAFNNLTDVGSSVIAVFSARISNRPPDRQHPHGHGRFEYVASLVVAFLIFTVGIELLRRSYDRLINPEPVEYSVPLIAILGFSVLVKLWMYSYNRYIAAKIHSSINRANAFDSLSDSLATGVILASVLVSRGMDVPVDGFLGLLISILIMYSGFDVARDTVNLLVGQSPEPSLIQQIDRMVRSAGLVVDVHDLEVHDYGPGRVSASVHAVVPDTAGIVETHTVIEEMEKKIEAETGVRMTIHMDPISTDEEKTRKVRQDVDTCLDFEPGFYQIEDFRIAQGQQKILVMFDLVFAEELKHTECLAMEQDIRRRIEHAFENYQVAINRLQAPYESKHRDLLENRKTQ